MPNRKPRIDLPDRHILDIVEVVRAGRPLYRLYRGEDAIAAKQTVLRVKKLYLAGELQPFLAAHGRGTVMLGDKEGAASAVAQESEQEGPPLWEERFRDFITRLEGSLWTVSELAHLGIGANEALEFVRRFDPLAAVFGNQQLRLKAELWLKVEHPAVPPRCRGALAECFAWAMRREYEGGVPLDLSSYDADEEVGEFAELALRFEPWRSQEHSEAFLSAARKRWPRSMALMRKRGRGAQIRAALLAQDEQEHQASVTDEQKGGAA